MKAEPDLTLIIHILVMEQNMHHGTCFATVFITQLIVSNQYDWVCHQQTNQQCQLVISAKQISRSH